ncbi:MAG: right-handed parallel beta-helix repeat-containing protein, partial [Candidatus Babeliales bacterium]
CEKFQYTWTALEFGFFDTQTILCAKFQDTWTILDHILLDTQTILCEKFQYTWTALEFGFFDTQTILCAKFQDTWTILESLQNTGCCQATPITQALVDAGGGTYVITQSGNYTLAENITSAGTGPGTGIIQISMSDVSLNLCGRKITGNLLSLNNGIFVDPNLSNIRIENGTLAMNGLSGIFIQSGCCDIWLDNITSSSAFWGIVLNDFITPGADFIANVFINRCQATNCSGINSKSPTRFTLSASGGLIMTNCRNVTIRNSNFSENTVFTLGAATTMDVFGLFMDNCSDCSLSHCTMNTNWGTQSGTGLTMSACNNNSFEYCIFNDNRGLTSLSVASGAFGAILSSCFNNVFRNCQANNNLNDQQARGFIATQGGNNTFINCIASGNNGPGGGFIFNEENSSSCIDCQALANTATVLAGDDCVGFMSESGRNILIENCQALGMVAEDVAAGFLLMGDTASSIINCICQNSNSLTGSGYGVLLDVDLINNVTCITCFVRDNNVMTTTGLLDAFGYRDAGSPNSSSLFTGNFAFNNNTNYSVVYPSGPLPTVSGSLSGGLPATGTSGTFDNIGINV